MILTDARYLRKRVSYPRNRSGCRLDFLFLIDEGLCQMFFYARSHSYLGKGVPYANGGLRLHFLLLFEKGYDMSLHYDLVLG